MSEVSGLGTDVPQLHLFRLRELKMFFSTKKALKSASELSMSVV